MLTAINNRGGRSLRPGTGDRAGDQAPARQPPAPGSIDLDAVPPGLRDLGHRELHHPVVAGRLRMCAVDFGRQGHRAGKRSLRDFAAIILAFFLFLLAPGRSLDGDCVLADRGFNIKY